MSLLATFQGIPGNERAKQRLAKIMERDEVPHSLLFTGPANSTKELFAEALARWVTQGYQLDITTYRPEGNIGMHSIDSLRQLTDAVYAPPYKAVKKAFLIYEADRMLPYSANALLKTFEEPALHSIIILLTSKPENLLPTILSRCFTLSFLGNSEINKRTEIQDTVLELLEQSWKIPHPTLLSFIKVIDGQIKQQQENLAGEFRKEVLRRYPSEYTTLQSHAIEKEVEGLLAMDLAQKAREVFEMILSWYRDLQLLAVGGDRTYLSNKDKEQTLVQALQRKEIVPLEQVQKAITQSQLALARFSPFTHCLEAFFLSLQNKR